MFHHDTRLHCVGSCSEGNLGEINPKIQTSWSRWRIESELGLVCQWLTLNPAGIQSIASVWLAAMSMTPALHFPGMDPNISKAVGLLDTQIPFKINSGDP